MSRRFLAALVGALVLAASAIAPAVAITGDFVDDHQHPFVGLIVFYDEEGEFSHRCSGSLLNSRVFLTAGHCTDDGAGGVMDSARIWFRQDAGTRFDGVEDPVSGYPNRCIDPRTGPNACVTAHEMYNYGFDNFAGFPNTRDAGIVILDTPVSMPEYGTVAPAGTLDAIKKRKGNTILTVSGYGVSHSAKKGTVTISFRKRLMAQSVLTNLRSSWNDGFNVQTQGNGSGRGGTCSGDSGGPVFLGGPSSNLIVAVTSFGKANAGCRGTDFAYRVDRGPVRAWIDQVSGSLWP